MPDPWIVLKFGGTSVSGAACWEMIAGRIRELGSSRRVWLVCSALSRVSAHLEQAIAEALNDEPAAALDRIRQTHRSFAREAGLDTARFEPVDALLHDLERLLQGVRLTRDASPQLRARILSFGELASTRLGHAVLLDAGLENRWVDARDLLTSRARPREQDESRYLDADVPARRDPQAADAVAGAARVVVTQGFVARTPKGGTCLLGRGGSDISAALFATMLGAERLEIWTDVHGVFTADPHQIPSARLVRHIDYREAEELAAMGAEVLHPRCLGPVRKAGIPLEVRNAADPSSPGTRIAAMGESPPAVTAVVCRRDATLVSVSTLEMWGASGFLARAFAPFEELGISIDLVATSQSTISVTLDRIPGGVHGEPFAALVGRLESMGRVKVVHPCAVVSIVGRRIRTVLHELGPALSAFREHQVHLVSESSEDLNLSFVVDEQDSGPLVENLHAQLFSPQLAGELDERFGPTSEMLAARRPESEAVPVARKTPWWKVRREKLLGLVTDGRPRFVYHTGTVGARARRLDERLPSISRFYYSMKANPHPRILETVVAAGFGLECVSAAEIERAKKVASPTVPIIFTPNFCPVDEYARALEWGAEVTVDGPHLLDQAPHLFRGREIAVRVDPGGGLGHHEKVRTAGARAKFGHPVDELDKVVAAAGRHGARIVGLHAHVGSGIHDPRAWAETAAALARHRGALPDLRWLDLGGGLGVVERPGQEPLDLTAVESALSALHPGLRGLELRMEPGRYLVSEAGVLLAPVTQVREKGGERFVGVATGMNSLLRPALYGAWHSIHNLTRLDRPARDYWHVVGPICETGDVLGRDRLLPPTVPGDVLLIENCGAYGAVMSSHYNMRPPAEELVL